MSAFIVSHECIAAVVVALHANDPGLRKTDADFLGMMLWQMNSRAVRQLYNGNVDYRPPHAYQHCPEKMKRRLDLLQVYKSLRCFVYQCSEGDVPDEWLYLRCVALQEQLAAIIGHKPDGGFTRDDVQQVYDDCEWG